MGLSAYQEDGLLHVTTPWGLSVAFNGYNYINLNHPTIGIINQPYMNIQPSTLERYMLFSLLENIKKFTKEIQS